MDTAGSNHLRDITHIKTRYVRGLFLGQIASYAVTLVSDKHGYVAVPRVVQGGELVLAQLRVASSEIHHRPFYEDRANFRAGFVSSVLDAIRRGEASRVTSDSLSSSDCRALSSFSARPPLAYCRVNPHSLPKTFNAYALDNLADWAGEGSSENVYSQHQ